MSKVTDAIKNSLTDEWQTSREIADIASFVSCTNIKPSMVYGVLSSLVKYNLVERTWEGTGSRVTCKWRKPQ